MVLLIEILVKIIAYSILAIGVWQLVVPLIYDYWVLKRRSSRVRKFQKTHVVVEKEPNKFHQHIRILVFSISKRPSEQKVLNFYGISILLFVVTTSIIVFLTGEYGVAILSGFMLMIMPYSLCRFRLAEIRAKASYAFMQEFHQLLHLYQSHKDVYRLVSNASIHIRDKNLRMAFVRLRSSMEKVRTTEHFIEAVQLLSFTIGSSFAARFANLMIKSYQENANVSEAILDLHTDLRKRERDMSVLKTKRMETIILGFMPVIFVPIFIFAAFRMTMLYEFNYIIQQTNSLILLVISVVLAVVSAMSAYLLSKPKADL